MTLSWRFAAASDVGLLREGNEDSAYAGQHLLAVADGMGGHAAGEVASAAVIAALEELDRLGVDAGDPEEALREAFAEANRTLRDMVAADSELQGMGTTVTAVLTDGAYFWLAHVGDSRAYLLRDSRLRQLTRDHTLVQQMVDDGRIAPDEVSTHPQRSVITRALDGRDGLDVDIEQLDFRPGDRLLLNSDGLSVVVSDESIAEALREGTPDDAVRRLVDLALRGGGPDNVTCVVADAVDAAVDADPLVAGAADETPAERAPSAAVQAAAVGRKTRDPDDPRFRARRLRGRRAVVVAVAVLALLAAGTAAGWAWVQAQYYVGASNNEVVIYRGVEGSLVGVDLSHVARHAGVALADLPQFEQKRVRDGIHAGSRAEAERIVARLEAARVPVCVTPATPKPCQVVKP